MNKNAILLVTRPEFDPAVFYLSKWSESIITEAKHKGLKIIDLHRDKACYSRFIGTLRKVCPTLVFVNGHGDDKYICGHNNEPILCCDDCDKKFNSKIIYARACNSSYTLGKVLVKNNMVLAYIGYLKPFVFETDPNKIHSPLNDDIARLFLEPSNYLVISLLKGHSVEESYNRSINAFKKNMTDLLLNESDVASISRAELLFHNIRSQTFAGDGSICI